MFYSVKIDKISLLSKQLQDFNVCLISNAHPLLTAKLDFNSLALTFILHVIPDSIANFTV